MTSKPKMSLFPKIALAVLDYVALFGTAFFVIIALAIPTMTVSFDGTVYTSRFFSLIFGFLFASFFWIAHLVLRRARFGQPFEKRNVKLLYWLAGMHVLYVVFTNNTVGHFWKWLQQTREGASLGFKLDTAAMGQFFVGSGLMLSLILFAFAAIFQRGVELREEEDRLRREAELTI